MTTKPTRRVTTCITGGFVFSGFPPLNFHINTQNKAFLKLEIYLSTHYFWYLWGVWSGKNHEKFKTNVIQQKGGGGLPVVKRIFFFRNLWIRVNTEILYLTLGGWWKKIQLILGSNFQHISSWKMIHFRLVPCFQGAFTYFEGADFLFTERVANAAEIVFLKKNYPMFVWRSLKVMLFSELSWTFLREKRPSKAKVSGNVFYAPISGHFLGRSYSWK